MPVPHSAAELAVSAVLLDVEAAVVEVVVVERLVGVVGIVAVLLAPLVLSSVNEVIRNVLFMYEY